MFFQLCLRFGKMPRYTDSRLAPAPKELPQKYGSSVFRNAGIPEAQKSKEPLPVLWAGDPLRGAKELNR